MKGFTMARTPGSKNIKEVVPVEPSRCPDCGSTDRTGYVNTDAQEHPGTTADGEPYTHIVRRRTICKNCGRHRIDRSYENRTTETEKEQNV